jgi:hypothetical protein
MRCAVILFSIAVGLFSIAGCGLVGTQDMQKSPPTSAEPAEAARFGLRTLAALAAKNPAMLGFSRPEEATAASLGDSIAVHQVRLDKLKEYQARTDPTPLLEASERIIYPVLVRDKAQSSVVVLRQGDKWEAAEFGGSALARSLVDVRSEQMASSGAPALEFVVVSVSALNVVFLARRTKDGLTVIPAFDYPEFSFKRGSALTGAEAFERLAEAARRHDGNPT